MRISVAHVVNLVANGMTPVQIVADLPDVEEWDVRRALAYTAALAQDELHTLRAQTMRFLLRRFYDPSSFRRSAPNANPAMNQFAARYPIPTTR